MDRVEDGESMATTKEEERDGEDAVMQSSPFQSSLPPQLDQGTGASSALTITLTREEDLDRMLFSLLRYPNADCRQRYAHNMNK